MGHLADKIAHHLISLVKENTSRSRTLTDWAWSDDKSAFW